MEKSSFFNSVSHDRTYKAEDWAEYFASFIGNGVFPDPSTGLQIVAGSGMNITVRPGKAWINGYFYKNTGDLTIALHTADGQLNRIDRIVVRWDLTNRNITIKVKSSGFSASPSAPALQRDADIYELALADVYVGAGVTAISQAVISDRRLNPAVCGVVAGVVDQIDTAAFSAQLDNFLNSFIKKSNESFEEYQARATTAYNSFTATINTYITELETKGNEDLSEIVTSLEEFKSVQEQQFLKWFEGIKDHLPSGGGLLPLLQVTTTAGATVRCTSGETVLEAVAGTDGAATIEIPAYGTWTARAEKSGYSPTQTVVEVDTCKIYPITLEFFDATITVTTKPGAMVRANRGNIIASATADSSGTAVIHPTISGTYFVAASVDGTIVSEIVSVEVANGGSYNVTCAFITLTVSADTGSNILVARGETRFNGVSTDGKAEFMLPETGTWTVTATKNGKVATGNVNVTEYTDYTVVLRFYKYYGVQIGTGDNPESNVTYIGDAAGHAAGYISWKNDIIIGSIRPRAMNGQLLLDYLDPNDFSKFTDGSSITSDTDVMIEVPAPIGYKIESDVNGTKVWVTNDPNAEGYCYNAHSLYAEKDCAAIYFGAFLACQRSDGLHSLPGATPITNISLRQARQYAQTRGEGFQLFSAYPLKLMQCMYLIIYKNTNGQEALGYGYSPGSSATAAKATGGTIRKGMCYGESKGQEQVKFLGMEDFWGNLNQWIDGLYCDADYTIHTAYTDFEIGGANYPYLSDSGLAGLAGENGVEGWVSAVIGNNDGGFCMTEKEGSSTTYYCDLARTVGDKYAYFGGNWRDALCCGPFRLSIAFADTASGATIGARLMYKKVMEVL